MKKIIKDWVHVMPLPPQSFPIIGRPKLFYSCYYYTKAIFQ